MARTLVDSEEPPRLSAGQRRILAIVHESLAGQGRMPTNEEIRCAAGLQSLSTVIYQLRQLAAKGFLPQP